jgi:hypothetical protein
MVIFFFVAAMTLVNYLLNSLSVLTIDGKKRDGVETAFSNL